jgi:hypothetical protein
MQAEKLLANKLRFNLFSALGQIWTGRLKAIGPLSIDL